MGSALTRIALRLGPLSADGYRIGRSGVRWLRQDGDLCRAGEVIGFCGVALYPDEGLPDARTPFAEERRDLHIALLAPATGRLGQAEGSSHGGFLDMLNHFQVWTAGVEIGHIEAETGDAAIGDVRSLMLAGRRAAEVAEVRSGLLTGWHDRSRGVRADGPGPIGTVLSLGICELSGVIRGERDNFWDILNAVRGPAQVVFVPDLPIVHSGPVIIGQIRRTDAERESIAQDMAKGLAGGAITPQPADWVFAGAVLGALQRCPVGERYDVLTRDGLRRTGPADAIILSLNAEDPVYFRHRRLGYALQFHSFRLEDAGPAFLAWLRANFEPVRRTQDGIRADYRTLIDLIRKDAPTTQVLICNVMSSSGEDDIHSYAAFDAPIGQTVAKVNAKELNLMLADLARERDVAIVDADAIAAEMGGQRSMPDGVHQNGEMQAEMRAEILRILDARGVPGFSPIAGAS